MGCAGARPSRGASLLVWAEAWHKGLSPSRTFGGRAIYDNPDVRLAQVDVGLPDGERVWRHVVRLHRAASVLVIDGQDRVLLLWRHRFLRDRWGWELPGGPVDDDEEPQAAAARELEDQAGYRAGQLVHLVSFEPVPDSVDGEHAVFVCRDAEQVGDAVSAEGVARSEWVPLSSVPELITSGDVWVAATLVGLLHMLARER